MPIRMSGNSALAAGQEAGAGAGAENIDAGPRVRVLENKDLISHVVQHLDLKSIFVLGGVSVGMRQVVVKLPCAIRVTAEILDKISAALKGKKSTLPSVLDSQNMTMDLKKASKADIILLETFLKEYPTFANGIISLDFSGNKNLSQDLLVGILGCTKQLKVLKLHNIGLTALPVELRKLTALTHLDVSHNQLGPPSLGRRLATLNALTGLEPFRDPPPTRLPPELGQLTALKEFDVHGNQLTELPDSLERLTDLAYLDVEGNPFIAFPTCINKLPLGCDVKIDPIED